MHRTHRIQLAVAAVVAAAAVAAALTGCGSSQEAVEVPLAVVASARGMEPGETDLGYTVTLDAARAALRDLEFTVGGETHGGEDEGGALARVWSWVVPAAHAHPGHAAGGDVTGVLAGPFLVDWMSDGTALGTALLLEGDYEGSNFTFRRAGSEDGLAEGDPLLGHTIAVAGTAVRGDEAIQFDAVIDIDDGTLMVGAPFVLAVAEGSRATLALELFPTDPVDGKSIWRGIDFAALDDDGDGSVSIRPGQDAHNVLRRNFQIHNHYNVDVR
jgi:hypothetical protein